MKRHAEVNEGDVRLAENGVFVAGRLYGGFEEIFAVLPRNNVARIATIGTQKQNWVMGGGVAGIVWAIASGGTLAFAVVMTPIGALLGWSIAESRSTDGELVYTAP